MTNSKKIGVLAFQGDVLEHINATRQAAKNSNLTCGIIEVRTKEQLSDLDALIIPGGESTVLQKLCERANIFEDMKKIKNIFGTCAGTITLAKTINNKEVGQRTLGLMDIEVDRNAYGRQAESFEQDLDTKLGRIHAIFIRAPKIKKIGNSVKILAKNDNEIIICEQKVNGNYYLAATFHPELTTTVFHEYFLRQIYI
ncbi:pyridoxal 5'-phosphate synthase glutaminase subunit PdxT [Candidatus Micrarchaeota archaeon]|nr:pyridoxal 5'-phosphate synthase glutaminase subunit PdxT [Candidatus Micrarchaeota archaeon]